MKLLLGIVALALAAAAGTIMATDDGGVRSLLVLLVASVLMLFATAEWS